MRNAYSACTQNWRFSSRAACYATVLFMARGLKLFSGFRYSQPFRYAGCGFASESGISDFRLYQPCLEQVVYACFYIFWHIYGPKSKLHTYRGGYIRDYMGITIGVIKGILGVQSMVHICGSRAGFVHCAT